jgi:hypothetical protein
LAIRALLLAIVASLPLTAAAQSPDERAQDLDWRLGREVIRGAGPDAAAARGDARLRLDTLRTMDPQNPDLPLLERRLDSLSRPSLSPPPLITGDPVGRRPLPRLRRSPPSPVAQGEPPEARPPPERPHPELPAGIALRLALIEDDLARADAARALGDLTWAEAAEYEAAAALEAMEALYGHRLPDAPAVAAVRTRLQAVQGGD